MMIKKGKSVKFIIKNNIYILNYVKAASPWFITLTMLISFTAFVDTISNTWLSKIVFDGMAQGTSYFDILISVVVILGMMLISTIVKALFHYIKTPVANEKIKFHIRSLLYEKTKHLDLFCFENVDFYDKYTRALTEADTRATNVLSTFSNLSTSIITLVTLFLIVIYLDPILVIFALIGAGASTIITRRLVKLRYSFDYGKTPLDREANYIQRVFYEPQYAKDMKMDNMFSYFVKSYKDTMLKTIHYIKDRRSKIAFFEFLSSSQMTIMQILMIIFLTYRVYNHIITIGDYAALLNSTFSLMFQLNILFSIIPEFYRHSLYAQNLLNIIQQIPITESEEGIVLQENSKIAVDFNNVSFSYPGSDKLILRNINMNFVAGEKHAIVGHNGAGKSTIIKLMLRLYDVTEGEILINGINIREYNVFSLRNHISTVFQDFQLYSIPITDYILSGANEKKSEEEVRKSLKNVGLYDSIALQEKGIHSILSKEFDSDGIVMSGGENQKLALAKAYVKQGTFMIFDEPSSALDPVSEYELHRKMMEFAYDKTIILISHRLSTTKDASIIYYIENGTLLEKGNHSTLMDIDGKYAKMFKIQATSYQLDAELNQ